MVNGEKAQQAIIEMVIAHKNVVYENKRFKELLREACDYLEDSLDSISGNNREFLDKPEIKKILEEK